MKVKRSPYFVLSPCGISALLHDLAQDERSLLNSFANAKSEKDLPKEKREEIRAIIAKKKELLLQTPAARVGGISAELKSLVKLYDGNMTSVDGQMPDQHVLLCTDTWLGEFAAQCVCAWLRGQGMNAHVERLSDLQTAEIEAFQSALTDLVGWCNDNIPNYHQAGYRVIFNLTAGFKSIQGFLQTLAMFYADESIYIFESPTAPLLRIPRLPVKMQPDETIKTNFRVFRRLAMSLDIGSNEIQGIEETLLLRMENDVTLSTWGKLVWDQTREHLYEEKIWPSPSPKIKYGPNFEKSVSSLEPQRCVMVNEKIDLLSAYLEGKRANLPSLDFKPLKGNPIPPVTHELDAWADQDAKRIFGYFENDTFVLDRLDKALH
jgi:putative CRISPR-associated protein (TIGR02619 family)